MLLTPTFLLHALIYCDCLLLSTGGAASFGGQQGAFAGKSQLQFYIKRNDAGTPDFSVQLSGSGVSELYHACSIIAPDPLCRLRSVPASNHQP